VWSLKEAWTETADARMAELLASCMRGWPPRSPAAARGGPGPGSSAKACRSVDRPARPISRADGSSYVARWERERASYDEGMHADVSAHASQAEGFGSPIRTLR